jgi:hypothetical protein
MYTFKIMFDTSVIQWTQDASEMYICLIWHDRVMFINKML